MGETFFKRIRTRVKKKESRDLKTPKKSSKPIRKVFSGIKARIPFGTRLGAKTPYTPLTLWQKPNKTLNLKPINCSTCQSMCYIQHLKANRKVVSWMRSCELIIASISYELEPCVFHPTTIVHATLFHDSRRTQNLQAKRVNCLSDVIQHTSLGNCRKPWEILLRLHSYSIG